MRYHGTFQGVLSFFFTTMYTCTDLSISMVVNLGPIAPTLQIPEITALTDFSKFFDANPRCLRRDVSQWVSSQWSRDIDSASLINNYTDIGSFQNTMQGNFAIGYYGVHSAGHYTIGGDPGGVSFALVKYDAELLTRAIGYLYLSWRSRILASSRPN